MRKQKLIRLPQQGIQNLAGEFEVSKTTIYSALRFCNNSSRAESIRKRAMEIGGIVESKTLFI